MVTLGTLYFRLADVFDTKYPPFDFCLYVRTSYDTRESRMDNLH